MELSTQNLTADDKTALGQLQQKASNLHQSSSNNFLVSLEGLMLSAIAWESIGKPKVWISNLSKATTAVGLVVTGLFAANAIRDLSKAKKIDNKLKQYGMDETTLPSEIAMQAPAPVQVVQAPAVPVTRPVKPSVPFMDEAQQPQTSISAQGAEISPMLQEQARVTM